MLFPKKWHMVCLLVFIVLLAPHMIANAAALTDEVTDVPVDKRWTITFNHPVIESSISPETIYVMNSKQEKQDVTFSVNGNIVSVHAPDAGYNLIQTYTLHITADVLGQVDQEVKVLEQPIIKPFTITEGYVVVNIEENGAYTPVANYSSFDAANASLQKQQGIRLHDKYVKIPAGFVATNPKAVTLLYKQASFTGQYEYAGVSADTELLYVDATENYIKVTGFGQDMYVKHEDVTLIPTAAAKGQSYYIADQNGLRHHIYHHHSGKYDGSYLVGKKPDFLKENVKYYSTDGANFIDANGNVAGQSHSYFQYVSPRVPTSYTAAELDAYIDSELAAKEQTGALKYANATTKSPLKSLGTTLKEIEQEHQINALLILAFAIHESDYGMSCHAQNNNNLFGLNIPDSNDQCSPNGNITTEKYFASIKDNIEALVKTLNTSYLDPLNMENYRYNGVALGNKMIGMNVRYASDPYWGAKIAGHMYRIDQALDSKDYQKYDIGFTSTESVSVRKEPVVTTGTLDNRAYQYKLGWTIKRLDTMPITLSNTPSETSGWLRIISELPQDRADLYTVTENVHIVPTH